MYSKKILNLIKDANDKARDSMHSISCAKDDLDLAIESIKEIEIMIKDEAPCNSSREIFKGSTIPDLEETRDAINAALRLRMVL